MFWIFQSYLPLEKNICADISASLENTGVFHGGCLWFSSVLGNIVCVYRDLWRIFAVLQSTFSKIKILLIKKAMRFQEP